MGGGKTWKNFSVEANSRFANRNFDGIDLLVYVIGLHSAACRIYFAVR